MCAEFGIRTQSVRSGVKSPQQEWNMMKYGLYFIVTVVVAVVRLLNGRDPTATITG